VGNVGEFVSKTPKERNHLGDQVVDEKINIKMVVKK
jgi:hypothetical protein